MAKAETAQATAVASPPPFAEQLADERTTQAMAKEEYRKAMAKRLDGTRWNAAARNERLIAATITKRGRCFAIR